MINELAAVLGTIGTVFGIWSINRQMDLERQYAELKIYWSDRMQTVTMEAIKAHQHSMDAHEKIIECQKWIDAYEHMTAQTAGEYRQQYDEKTQQTTYKHMDAIDPKEALLSAPGFRDKLEATKARLGYK